jgi:hypothetical protein
LDYLELGLTRVKGRLIPLVRDKNESLQLEMGAKIGKWRQMAKPKAKQGGHLMGPQNIWPTNAAG